MLTKTNKLQKSQRLDFMDKVNTLKDDIAKLKQLCKSRKQLKIKPTATQICVKKWQRVPDEICNQYEKPPFLTCKIHGCLKDMHIVHDENGEYICFSCSKDCNIYYLCVTCQGKKNSVLHRNNR